MVHILSQSQYVKMISRKPSITLGKTVFIMKNKMLSNYQYPVTNWYLKNPEVPSNTPKSADAVLHR